MKKQKGQRQANEIDGKNDNTSKGIHGECSR